MGEPWSVQRVEAAAPDSASAVAGRKLAKPGPWSDVGVHGDLIWGSCQGSGKTPYAVSVDVAAPAYKCSCPSRKFPCKHALALLFLWAQGQIRDGGTVAAFAAEWAEGRLARGAAKPKSDAPAEQTEEQKAAAAERAARREEWVTSGLEELQRFLADQVREGLATHAADRPARLERLAARMVDAQAPTVANSLRSLAAQPVTTAWPQRVLDAYASLHLLATGWRNRDALPPDLVASIRSHIGFTTRSEDVLATPGVRDRWAVVGLRDSDEEQVSMRRVWLWGRATGRRALVLFFSPSRSGLDSSLYPGSEVEADLHFYPGRPQLRAVMGERIGHTERSIGWATGEASIAAAVADLRDAVAADPWLDAWPVALTGEVGRHGGEFWLRADGGLRLTGTPRDLWRLLAEVAGSPVTLFGELSADGLRPTAWLDDGEVRPL